MVARKQLPGSCCYRLQRLFVRVRSGAAVDTVDAVAIVVLVVVVVVLLLL